jgi:HlyD family secretion protein
LSLQTALEMETRFKSARAMHDAAVERYKIVQESGVPIGLVNGSSTQRLNVSAPMDGVIIRRNVELGDTVTSGVSSFNAGTIIATVADVGTMIIKAGINEVDIVSARR